MVRLLASYDLVPHCLLIGQCDVCSLVLTPEQHFNPLSSLTGKASLAAGQVWLHHRVPEHYAKFKTAPDEVFKATSATFTQTEGSEGRLRGLYRGKKRHEPDLQGPRKPGSEDARPEPDYQAVCVCVCSLGTNHAERDQPKACVQERVLDQSSCWGIVIRPDSRPK